MTQVIAAQDSEISRQLYLLSSFNNDIVQRVFCERYRQAGSLASVCVYKLCNDYVIKVNWYEDCPNRVTLLGVLGEDDEEIKEQILTLSDKEQAVHAYEQLGLWSPTQDWFRKITG